MSNLSVGQDCLKIEPRLNTMNPAFMPSSFAFHCFLSFSLEPHEKYALPVKKQVEVFFYKHSHSSSSIPLCGSQPMQSPWHALCNPKV